MISFVENETEQSFDFDIQKTVEDVVKTVVEKEGCPYDVEINLLITDAEGIREYNREYRDIDRETDVLSFPNISFSSPSDFSIIEGEESDYVDPENGLLVLGDIIINASRVKSQALEYGHSERREFAFLTAHSMFHLCGYDHMTEVEAKDMEQRQEAVLQKLQITRD